MDERRTVEPDIAFRPEGDLPGGMSPVPQILPLSDTLSIQIILTVCDTPLSPLKMSARKISLRLQSCFLARLTLVSRRYLTHIGYSMVIGME